MGAKQLGYFLIRRLKMVARINFEFWALSLHPITMATPMVSLEEEG